MAAPDVAQHGPQHGPQHGSKHVLLPTWWLPRSDAARFPEALLEEITNVRQQGLEYFEMLTYKTDQRWLSNQWMVEV